MSISHVSPEAAEGGPIGLAADGDPIQIDLEARTIKLFVEDDVLEERRAAWEKPPSKIDGRGYLAKYQKLVTSANTGGVMKV
ncbi:dihydroxy-acid dehydratase domain-containing protein [Pontibacillus chungwhensis]|uniref:dihydroxy-acid dehydratase domain-containing protein n=1 Tax=Pontibacillus chungwhensis TaxID=265426 RepID=UPI000A04C652